MAQSDKENRGGKPSEQDRLDRSRPADQAAFATSQFGKRRFDDSLYAAALRLRQQQAELQAAHAAGQGGNQTGRADKWELLRALTEARTSFNLSDRTITVLEALASFHGSRELDGSSPIIVFPSNRELSLRTRGMAHPTLRRHLAALVDAGLIFRRDSPNGKRYVCRNGAGQIEQAFGFDLSPFALQADAIYQAAEDARRHALLIARVRSEITVHLRDLRSLIDAGLSEREEVAEAALWSAYADRLGYLSGRVSRTAALEDHERRLAQLVRLRAEAEKTWLDGLCEIGLHVRENQEMSASAAVSERHIQNSKPESTFDKQQGNEKEAPEIKSAIPRSADGTAADEGMVLQPELGPMVRDVPPLARILALCADMEAYAQGGRIATWQDLLRTADLVRSMLGISPDAWLAAQRIMGAPAAAVTVACILQKGEMIKAPGGYLRALTTRAEQGKFTLTPMLKALEGDGD